MAKGDLMSPEYRKFWHFDHEEPEKLVVKEADPVTKIEIPRILNIAMGYTASTGSSYLGDSSPIISGSYVGPFSTTAPLSPEPTGSESVDDNEFVFREGCMWEGYPWKILLDVECSELDGREPCRHCHGDTVETHKRRIDDSTYTERTWVCPRVVVAYNEGECNSTGVCLDCILEAAKTLEEK